MRKPRTDWERAEVERLKISLPKNIEAYEEEASRIHDRIQVYMNKPDRRLYYHEVGILEKDAAALVRMALSAKIELSKL